MSDDARATLLDPMLERNPAIYQILGICPALAITTLLENAIVMTLATTAVLTLSNVVISALRKLIPDNVRIITYLTIVASLVIVADQILGAFFFEISRQLSVYIGLIITNCIILGRAEAFAAQNPPLMSALDGIGTGLGYGLVLCVTAFFRELLGRGEVLGIAVLPTLDDGGWFQTVGLMTAPAGAFFLVMILIWVLRSWKRGQIEEA